MCGVFGFVSYNGEGPNLKRLEIMARITETRGPHSFGFAWVDSRDRLRMYKQRGRISHHLGVLALASDAKMLIGHCRYATHGRPEDNVNNHPHPADGGWIVHNGVLGNHRELIAEHGLTPVSDCDSEVLGLLIEHGDGSLLERAKSAALQQSGPLVLCGLWARPNRLILVRSGKPLAISRHDGGRFYFASSEHALAGSPEIVPDNTAIEFGAKRIIKASSPLGGSKAARRRPAYPVLPF